MTDLDGKRRLVTPLQSIVLIDVRLESAEGDLIPDIVAVSCPPEKLEKLRSMDVDVLEIDVSG
ncbi:hypothetical protein [Rhizobium leguminosarum]|uniref:hypothetical protein n=1 Tax=Rhizobium leguminosarum TaxID=384 RepID=UPI0014418BBB|nr:hypothetical protein [Rhizobium leguminosarum]NKJ77805.1 hypothetical protein [Rhizobium leguminosarum bv. viciae]